ncbi:MAG: NAD+ synthase [Anaerolineae bacterium]|nr:NAD+ synthase [Anaerolineae bacterium]
MTTLRIALAQINVTVGDLEGNTAKVSAYLEQARAVQANIVLFPELTLSGYPPEDLLLKPGFVAANRAALESLLPHTHGLTAIVGFTDKAGDLFNAAAVLHNGQLAAVYHKSLLPNYAVFDEDRYFAVGDTPLLFNLSLAPSSAVCFGVSVCEDIWYPAGPPETQAAAGAELLLNISASPYQSGKIQSREQMLATRAADNVAILAFCNLVGGQDELIFDGSSLVLDERGQVLARGRAFAEELVLADVNISNVFRQRLRDPRHRKDRLTKIQIDAFSQISLPAIENATAKLSPLEASVPAAHLEPVAEVYQALVLGTRDYVRKNGFSKVTMGLSGGIDSSLVAVIAADALGPENVIGVSMPARYSSDHSQSDAAELAQRLGIGYEVIAVEPVYQAYLDILADVFTGAPPNEAEENLQSRARGNTLMALSNKFGWLVLTTGNKSEMAVGYATIYGDMAGGFAVIKDVPKTLVYQLCRYRNQISNVIPENVLTKPPSAELRPDQKDTDSLPEYDLLDGILAAYIEDEYSAREIIALGYDEETVRRVIRMVDRNEYKRRQAPPGPKITSKSFGKDRRLPITNRYVSARW